MRQVFSLIGVIGILLVANCDLTAPVAVAMVVSCGFVMLGINQ